ncbi:hypothetical protein Q7P36_002027 [Cladosporium allicinum]
MGAVASCFNSVVHAITSCFMAIVNGIVTVIKAIINGIVAFFSLLANCLTCGKAGGRRKTTSAPTTIHSEFTRDSGDGDNNPKVPKQTPPSTISGRKIKHHHQPNILATATPPANPRKRATSTTVLFDAWAIPDELKPKTKKEYALPPLGKIHTAHELGFMIP